MPEMARQEDNGDAAVERVLDLDKIVVDDSELRVREREHEDRVAHFVEIFDQLPLIEVFDVRGTLYLVDGSHRYHAAKADGRSSLRAKVRKGTRAAAIERALTANSKSDLSLNRREQRDAVVRLKRIRPAWSNRELGRAVGVSEGTVRNVTQYLTLRNRVPMSVLDRLTVRKLRALVKAKPEHRLVIAKAAVRDGWSAAEIRERGEGLRNQAAGRDRLKAITRANEEADERDREQARWEERYPEAAEFVRLLTQAGEIGRPPVHLAEAIQQRPLPQGEDSLGRGLELVTGFAAAWERQRGAPGQTAL